MTRLAAGATLVALIVCGTAVLVPAARRADAHPVVPSVAPAVALAVGGDDEKPKKSVDPAAVYYGDPTKWEKPAEVDPDAVYAEIEEYKQILEQKLKPSDPKYSILMSKASKRFSCAVRKTAKDAGYDLVAKTGSVKGVDSVPVITTDVIANL